MSQLASLGYFFLPEEMLVLVIAAAGIALIVGARALAASLMTFVIITSIAPIILQPLIQQVPVWVLWALAIYALFLLPYFILRLFGGLVEPALGKRETGNMIANLASAMTMTFLAAPFLVLRAIVRSLSAIFRSLRA